MACCRRACTAADSAAPSGFSELLRAGPRIAAGQDLMQDQSSMDRVTGRAAFGAAPPDSRSARWIARRPSWQWYRSGVLGERHGRQGHHVQEQCPRSAGQARSYDLVEFERRLLVFLGFGA